MVTRLMDASEGMQILAASGMETNDILKTSGDMLTLMSAGGTDADTAASVLTNTMAQFNLTADDSQRIIDGFSQGAASAKLGVDDLEYIMGQAGGTLASMNMEMEESIAMAGQLANAGTPIGTIGTTLNAMGREIKANAKEFKELGIQVYDSSGKLKGADKVMMELEGKLDGMTDAQRDAALSSVFSGQAMKGAVDWLSKGSEAYKELAGEINDAEGAAQSMSDIMEDNFGGAMRSLQSALGTVMIGIGDVIKGPIQKGADKIKELAGAFNDLDPDKKGLIVKLGAVAMAIGPLLKGGGKLIGLIAKFAGAFNPITLLIGAIIAGFSGLYLANDEFRESVHGVISQVGEWLGQVIPRIVEFFGQLRETVGEFFANSNIVETITNVFTAIGTVMETFFHIAKFLWDNFGGAIKEIVKTTFSVVGGLIEGSLNIISGIFQTFGSILQGDWSGAWDGLKMIVQGFIDWFKTIPDIIVGIIKTIGKSVVGVVKSLAGAAGGFISSIVGGGDKDGKKARVGISNVPYDGYPIQAHKGEMLLTKRAADDYRAAGGTKSQIPTVSSPRAAQNISFEPNISINVQGNADKETVIEMERQIEKIIERERNIFLAKLKLGGGKLEFS